MHAQLVEPEAVLIKAAAAQLRVVLTEPHAHPDVLDLDVEVHRAFDVDKHRLAVAVEQDMVRAELAVHQRGSRARLNRPGQRVQRFLQAALGAGRTPVTVSWATARSSMTLSHDAPAARPPASMNATFPGDGDRTAAMASSHPATTDKGRSAAAGSFSSRASRLPPATSSTTAMSAGYRDLDGSASRSPGQRTPTDARRRAAASNSASPDACENGSAGSPAPSGSTPCQ